MRITKEQLKRIIAQEVSSVLRESVMSDMVSVEMQDEPLAARGAAYDDLAGALVDAGADSLDMALDMIAELDSTASMGPLGTHALGSAAGAPGGDLEAAWMNIADVDGTVDEAELAAALGRLGVS